jgi:hypothetical protein
MGKREVRRKEAPMLPSSWVLCSRVFFKGRLERRQSFSKKSYYTL